MIFLLPSLSFTIGGIALKWNFFNLLLLFSLLFYVKRYHLNISISECKPFFWYFGVLFLFIPIEYELSYSYQLITWFGNVLRYFIVPLAMFSLFKENNVREVIFLNYIVYVCIHEKRNQLTPPPHRRCVRQADACIWVRMHGRHTEAFWQRPPRR